MKEKISTGQVDGSVAYEAMEPAKAVLATPQPNPYRPIRATCKALRATLVYVEDSRAKSLALTKLDEFELWIGRAIDGDSYYHD